MTEAEDYAGEAEAHAREGLELLSESWEEAAACLHAAADALEAAIQAGEPDRSLNRFE